MKNKDARQIGNDFIKQISPYCLRVEIAGSVRRENPEVKDVEICAIPKDLFGLKTVMDRQYYLKGKFPAKYSQITFQAEKIDIFWCTRENWGNIFLIRTGDWEFSKWIMGTKLPEVGIKARGGYLWAGINRLTCLEEMDVFELLGMNFIEPKARIYGEYVTMKL